MYQSLAIVNQIKRRKVHQNNTPQGHVEAHDTRVSIGTGHESNIFVIGVCVAVPSPRHGKVELCGQIALPGLPLRFGDHEVIEGIAELAGVHYLPVVDPCRRISYHIHN